MSFIYLAMPWEKLSEEARWRALNHSMEVASWLIRQGESVYHPIQQGAGVERFLKDTNQPPIPHETWIRHDTPFLAAAGSLLVLSTIPGWRESVGVRHEISYMEKIGRSVFYTRRNSSVGQNELPYLITLSEPAQS